MIFQRSVLGPKTFEPYVRLKLDTGCKIESQPMTKELRDALLRLIELERQWELAKIHRRGLELYRLSGERIAQQNLIQKLGDRQRQRDAVRKSPTPTTNNHSPVT